MCFRKVYLSYRCTYCIHTTTAKSLIGVWYELAYLDFKLELKFYLSTDHQPNLQPTYSRPTQTYTDLHRPTQTYTSGHCHLPMLNEQLLFSH